MTIMMMTGEMSKKEISNGSGALYKSPLSSPAAPYHNRSIYWRESAV